MSNGAATAHSVGEGIAIVTLQQAYDAAVTPPQITIDGTPNPLTIDASVSGNIFALRSVANTNLFNVSTTQIDIADIPVVMTNALSPAVLNYTFADTFTTGGAFIGGVLSSTGTITYNNSVFIWALLAEGKTYLGAVAPGFAAFTLFNAQPTIQNSGNFDLVQALVLNVGVVHRRASAGTSTTVQTIGMSFSPQTATSVSGAVMTRSTGMTAVRVSPTFNTVAGSTVNMGTVVGLQCVAPAVALFGSQAGTENITAYYGLDWVNNAFGGASRVISVVRSNQASGTNIRFLDHTGNAASRLRGNLVFDVDSVGLLMGASGDSSMLYSGTANAIQYAVVTPATTVWQFSAPSTGRLLLQGSAAILSELNINVSRFSIGAQTGAVGNQIGVFVAPATTVTVAGEFSQYLLTQAGNITVNANIDAFGWTINAPSFTAGTGTLTTAAALNIGGNPNLAVTNRIGLRIISNPSGGAGINAALWVTAGLSRFDGRVDINQPIALGGGAAATLGTIGGTGPTAAAQAQWVEIDINGVAHWIPAWT